MKLPGPRSLLVTVAVATAVLVSLGGGGTFVALEITTKPEFCTSCHIMQPYYDSWASSSHAGVSCVECHYEPGLLETFEGKFKALSQLAKYVTQTQGSKPWAEVSDQSCMRSGCHSARLLEGPIQFGRVKFDHSHHLSSLRRGKRLRCTSCHSQIVQGDHLTVTSSSCFLCHFKKDDRSHAIDDCDKCHGPPEELIALGDQQFRHADYLDRGVQCAACHGDVVRGEGNVPRERCGSCHNQQAHLDRIDDVEFMHRNHVTDHAVPCLDCHLEIEHGLPSREQHYAGQCTDCHSGTHGVPSDTYRGTGVDELAGEPSVMYLARVTCQGCHRPPFPGAAASLAGATFEADPLACLDCHGTGFEGMLDRWQAETGTTVEGLQGALAALHERLDVPDEEWALDEQADPDEARRLYARAADDLGRVLLDGSGGVHNLPFTRTLLGRAREDTAAAFAALGASRAMPKVTVGPVVSTAAGCTTLCHVGIEAATPPVPAGLPFDHGNHVQRRGLDCSQCHAADPHAGPSPSAQTCTDCHHASDSADACGVCHADQGALRAAQPDFAEPSPMWEFDCVTCHSDLASGHSVVGMQAGCDFCHEDVEPDFAATRYEPWKVEAAAPLRALLEQLGDDAQAPAEAARAELQRWLEAGAYHNEAWTRERAEALAATLEPAEEP